MTDHQTEHEWERQRARVAVPDGFADRVMAALAARGAAGPEASPAEAVPSDVPAPSHARLASPLLRAALVLVAAGACLFRVYHATRLFSP